MREQVRRDLLAEGRKHSAMKLLRQIPSIGPIRAVLLKAQQRLHQRYKKLLAKGKNKGVVMTAVGRELLGFIWAIGIQVETAQKEPLQRAT